MRESSSKYCIDIFFCNVFHVSWKHAKFGSCMLIVKESVYFDFEKMMIKGKLGIFVNKEVKLWKKIDCKLRLDGSVWL